MKKFNAKELLSRDEMKKTRGGFGYGCGGFCWSGGPGECRKDWISGDCRCWTAGGFGNWCN